MNSDIKVIKSDGSKVSIDLDKIHRMVEKSCRGITGVSESLVEMNSGLQFYEMGETERDEALEKIALIYQDLITKSYDTLALEAFNFIQFRIISCNFM